MFMQKYLNFLSLLSLLIGEDLPSRAQLFKTNDVVS